MISYSSKLFLIDINSQMSAYVVKVENDCTMTADRMRNYLIQILRCLVTRSHKNSSSGQ